MKLKLENMEVHVKIGLHNWEKVITRLVLLNVEIAKNGVCNVSLPNISIQKQLGREVCETNAYACLEQDVIDTRILKKLIVAYCTSTRFDYLEDLVLSLKMHLMKKLDITMCRVTAQKIPFLMHSYYLCED